jgi:uncharacterized protein YcbK (DUF882 family)
MKMKLSANFERSEFACRCGCGFATVDVELLRILERVRARFGPVEINSGCRCEAYNEEIGGAKGSKHKQGIAADIVVKDTHPEMVYNFLESIMDGGGLGRYKTFTHVDVREGKARWQG